MDGLSADVLQFEGFRFDRAGGCLTRLDGPGVAEPVALGSRALDVLALLVKQQGQLVSKDEIMKTVWPGTAVEEGNLTVQISALRRVLDRDRTQGSCIQTIPGRGYRFIPAVTRVEGEDILGDGARVPLPLPDKPSIAVPCRRHSVVAPITGAIAAVLVIATLSWWVWPSTRSSSTTPAAVAATTSVAQPLVAPRLSIVVLPFANLSNDPDQQYFADGITDDLITDLSRITDMFVIARNTAFTYRNKPVDAKQIGRELGVHYLLEGSVQRSASRVRVNGQLIDAQSGAHLWAERFDRDVADLFTVQDEITRRIAEALNGELIAKEAARSGEHPDALDYILRGRAEMLKLNSPKTYAAAISFFERASALDPDSVEARGQLAEALANRALDGMSNSRTSDLAHAEELIRQVLVASPNSPQAHFTKGEILRAQGRFTEASFELETVLKFDSNNAWALFALAHCRLHAGSIEEVIPLVERAILLSPRDPNLGLMYYRIGEVDLLQSRIDKAITWLEKARSANPEYSFIRAFLAAAYGLSGDAKRATAELAEARRLQGEGSYSSIAVLKKGSFGLSNHALFEATFFAGLRKAGLQEE